MGSRAGLAIERRDAREHAAPARACRDVPPRDSARKRSRRRPSRRRHGEQRGRASDDGRRLRAVPGARPDQRRHREWIVLRESRSARGLRCGAGQGNSSPDGPHLHRRRARRHEAPRGACRARAPRESRERRRARVPRRTRHAAAKRARDRKSTRLNSSHLVISYAVFCLKKKKKKKKKNYKKNKKNI